MDLVVQIGDDYGLDNVYPVWLPRTHIARQFITCFGIATFGGYALYLIFAALNYQFFYDRNYERHPKFLKNQVQQELWVACTSIPFMGLLTAPIFVAEVRGHSQLYTDVGSGWQNWGYLLFSASLFMVFNDTLIYWIHRALHTKLLYKHIHKTHHKWLVPTPFASHAFHPVDGWLQSLPYHLFVFLIPFHKITYLSMFVLVNFWTISIHDGNFQIPKSWEWLVNGAAHHTDHHMYYNYNHGQYFTFWDRIGGTFRNPSPFEGNGPLDQLRDLEKKGKLKPTLETKPKDS